MTRTTIDFGIDLGTTNSVIAVLHRTSAEIIKNNDGDETTPSAVWADRRGRLHVGRAARERAESEPDRTCVEFKLRMGTAGAVKTLAGTPMTPEALSAEVLKSLCADAEQRLGERPRAVVVTVPAAFDLSACDATHRAARQAGLESSPLLREPVAAAHCYGLHAGDGENATWLVYDLGGGTFDAAVIRLRDGEFTVLRHAGDNFLGGKLIDWRIVDELLIPAAVRQAPALAGLDRGDPHWAGVVAKLKQSAERAKLALSRTDVTDVDVELTDYRGNRHDLLLELNRTDVERLAEPIVARSLNLCRDALAAIDLDPAEITKVLMVGGQTAMPYVRERVAGDLGIPLAFDEDPMTVVARGAAIFAGSQPLRTDQAIAPPPGTHTAELSYPRAAPDIDPVVLGKITAPDGRPAGLYIEIVDSEAVPGWRSGRVKVGDDGRFRTTLWATRGQRHTYELVLTDETGNRMPVAPDRLSYLATGVEADPVLSSTIGIGLHGNEAQPLVKSGTTLPARESILLRTTRSIHHGQSGDMLHIPVIEGDHARADRNVRIGRLEVHAEQVERSVPAGSEVRLTVHIDTSRIVRAHVDVPILGRVFDHVIDLNTESPPEHTELADMAERERARLAAVRERARTADSPLAGLHLARIDDERISADVDELVHAGRASADEALAARKRVLDLRIAIDSVEDELHWPELVAETESTLAQVRDLIAHDGTDADRAMLEELRQTIAKAVEARDARLLRQRQADLLQFAARVLDRGPTLQIMVFHNLEAEREQMRNRRHADRLLAEGRRAIDAGQTERLRQINMQLQAELPPEQPAQTGLRSDVNRFA